MSQPQIYIPAAQGLISANINRCCCFSLQFSDLDAMLFAWSESLLPGSSSYAENIVSPNPDKTDAPSLLSFGSYRLGVHTPDADVDCLVLAPPHVTRDDFFGSWVDILKGEERVTELHPVAR